ncbi:MAG TPA: universal stress protein [Nitrosopumilaceae archaeon]|jgi:nucleotide-binding universal stress UspA family protein
MIKKQIRNILVPLDGSQNSIRGLDVAIYVARQCHAIVTGIYIMPISIIATVPSSTPFYSTSTIPSFNIIKKLKDDAKRFLESAKVRAAQRGIMLKTVIMEGQPGLDVIRVAHNKKNKVDLIVVGSRGRGSAKELFFGSTSNYILHKAKMPVIVVK